jgi:hypothetical protein
MAALLVAACPCRADMVVARWGTYRHAQHRNVTFRNTEAGRAMVVDLAPIPRRAEIYRARLVFLSGSGFEVRSDGKALKLVEPYCLWFDATDAVRRWVRARKASGELVIRGGGRYRPADVYLEIAWKGKLADKPQQVTGLKGFHRSGQTFLTWKEIEDIAGGNAEIAWGEMVKKVRACNPMVGIVPKWPDREIRYSVYRHTQPVTAANIHKARFIHDAAQGSVYQEDSIARGRHGEHGPVYLKAGQVLRRVMLAKGEFLPPGMGYHWVNAPEAGKAWYAVVTSVNGVENTTDLGPANTFGPVEEKPAAPLPMLVAEQITDLRSPKGAKYHERWYSWWCVDPLSAYPRRYDVAVGFCPQTVAKSPALTIVRESWNYPIRMPRPTARKGIVMGHTLDVPIGFRMGCAGFHHNLKSPRQARWRPWPMRRQEALVEWLTTEYAIDRRRISVSMGAWGMMEIERPDLYALIHGYGQPEVTKGFQCWNRANGIWGAPDVYKGRPDRENPFFRSDYSRYVLADPARETPFFQMYAIRSAHLTEMGYPALPRFWRAMIDSRHPFIYDWRTAHRPTLRLGDSVPAFGNCTLDGNPGSGDLSQGAPFDAPINSWLTWDSESIVDGPARWEATVVLDCAAPLPACAVDLTPRLCRKFRPAPGDAFTWKATTVAFKGNAAGRRGPPKRPWPAAEPGELLGSGHVRADRHGLVTIRRMPMRAGAQRVVIEKR